MSAYQFRPIEPSLVDAVPHGGARGVRGARLEAYPDAQFLDAEVRSVHVHSARAGCFLCAFISCDENAGRDDRSVETAAHTD